MLTLTNYRMSYNAHRYQDCSDPARPSQRTIKAPDLDSAWAHAWAWRDLENEKAMDHKRQTFIGLIHSLELV